MKRPERIFLIGFSGTGKSCVAHLAAQMLGWEALDTDAMVEEEAGLPIPQIFRRWGEAWFREAEARALGRAAARRRVVVATGGGIVLRPQNRQLMARQGFVVCLEACPQTILARLQGGEAPERPLLQGRDPLRRIMALKARRQHLYALADHTIHTDRLSPEEVAREVVRAWRRFSAGVEGGGERLAPEALFAGAACVVSISSGPYPVYVGWDLLDRLGELVAGLGGRVFLVSDETVFRLHGQRAIASLERANLPTVATTVPPGEESKDLAMATRLLDWLVAHRAERGDVMVALGGGMVTDLAGFVAAIYARGMPLVHAPTTLLAMVDAAIGGKVAVNHPKAKNMVGAFHHPAVVVSDLSTLTTLSPREVATGWAETIKHGLVADPGLLDLLEDRAEALLALEKEAITETVSRSAAVKAMVVAEDEREESGRRAILNYGHTVGHALEAATGYSRLYHGEAVSVGMMAAAHLGLRLGLTPPHLLHRQRRLLERFRLPTSVGGVAKEALWQALALDKKVQHGRLRWVLLKDVGRPVVTSDVPLPLVEEALDSVLSP
jgi:shikimate kinase/3-dehydroquinate synthase